jgi:nickel transport protein
MVFQRLRGKMHRHNKINKLFEILVLSLFFLFITSPVNAHRVIIFGWVDGGMIHTESKFSGGKRVQNGTVIVSDAEGKHFLEGKTNDQGEFSFKIPEKTDIRIELLAGMGHKAEWTIPTEEIGAMPANTAATAASLKSDAEQSEKRVGSSLIHERSSPTPPDKKTQPMSASEMNSEAIQAAVEKALDKKLKPLLKMLAENQASGPTLRDIIGGIGYILGLMGMAAYFHYRRKKE